MCDCVRVGEKAPGKAVRAEISFKVVLLNLAYITGILMHDMCGSSSGGRAVAKFAPSAETSRIEYE